VVLLILFISYIYQTTHRPYMSTAEREDVLKHHQAKIHSGSHKDIQKHLELEGRLKEIDERISHEKRLKGNLGKFDEIDDSYAKARQLQKYFWDFNTVEQTLLACAILVCLAGIMFESPRFDERDDLQWQKDLITYLIIIVIVYSIVYYCAIFCSEFFGALGCNQSKVFRFLQTRKYRERTNEFQKEIAGAEMAQEANPMIYARDLEAAEIKAEVTGKKAEELMGEVARLKELNESLVSEVNEAKKREASSNLAHYASSPSQNSSKHKKKKKAFPGASQGNGSQPVRKSMFDTMSDKFNAARRPTVRDAEDQDFGGMGPGDMDL